LDGGGEGGVGGGEGGTGGKGGNGGDKGGGGGAGGSRGHASHLSMVPTSNATTGSQYVGFWDTKERCIRQAVAVSPAPNSAAMPEALNTFANEVAFRTSQW